MSVSDCLCVCLSVRDHTFELRARSSLTFMHVTHGRGSVLLWRGSDTLRISVFLADVIFAHELIGCSASPPG